jgi:threonine synthase
MKRVLGEQNYLLDPHTAVGVAVAHHVADEEHLDPAVPIVTLATAHPAKFPAAVAAATGVTPSLPPHLADLMERVEHMDKLPNDQEAVEAFVVSKARIAAEAV